METIRTLFSNFKKGQARPPPFPLVAYLLADIREKELFGINWVNYKKKHFWNIDLKYHKETNILIIVSENKFCYGVEISVNDHLNISWFCIYF